MTYCFGCDREHYESNKQLPLPLRDKKLLNTPKRIQYVRHIGAATLYKYICDGDGKITWHYIPLSKARIAYNKQTIGEEYEQKMGGYDWNKYRTPEEWIEDKSWRVKDFVMVDEKEAKKIIRQSIQKFKSKPPKFNNKLEYLYSKSKNMIYRYSPDLINKWHKLIPDPAGHRDYKNRVQGVWYVAHNWDFYHNETPTAVVERLQQQSTSFRKDYENVTAEHAEMIFYMG